MSQVVNSTVYLQGGLGNQLFQYAFYLNHKNVNVGVQIDAGRLFYDRQHSNISVVDFLQLDSADYIVSENKVLPCLIKGSILAKYIRYISRVLNFRKTPWSFYDYDAMSDFDCVDKNKKNYIGYFQFVESALFSKSYIESRLVTLYPKQLLSYSKNYGNNVGLHIRRGDFVHASDPKHYCVGLDYIKSAINASQKQVVVFSDDIVWCKNNLSDYPSLIFHNGESAFDDFLALSQCSNYILSGSTFSWWAAFLFSSADTKIIFPKEQKAQFLSKRSNEKVGWKYSAL
ncbi:alpha-1,2-fucosyltransferase [Vibrio aestuarianus]|uniref:Alpha-1,2-fucosyltransferase n=1 Tax=Vibrio aestuarianus TaxID=28171 RepID=A0A9X4FEL5_9VIBR|nr:alpha-1,2-fucosyltransferase [Vibrio aestuarianus]MDE1357270.1 alpha-1,2-fucosyltransferase [Vibrio aestuarianus]